MSKDLANLRLHKSLKAITFFMSPDFVSERGPAASNITKKNQLGEKLFYCLNLERRPDRRIQAWRQFRRERLNVKRFDAHDSVNVCNPKGYRNIGARACSLGHRSIWRSALKCESDSVVVFEDDIVLCPSFRERLDKIWGELPDDWMLLYFGCVFHTAPVQISQNILKVTGPTWDMHAYAIRQPLWKHVNKDLLRLSLDTEVYSGSDAHQSRIDALDTGINPTGSACDVVLAEYHGKFPTYAVWPPMAWQVNGLSNNENAVRGNYRGDGTQVLMRHAIRHLTGEP